MAEFKASSFKWHISLVEHLKNKHALSLHVLSFPHWDQYSISHAPVSYTLLKVLRFCSPQESRFLACILSVHPFPHLIFTQTFGSFAGCIKQVSCFDAKITWRTFRPTTLMRCVAGAISLQFLRIRCARPELGDRWLRLNWKTWLWSR